MAKTKNCIMAFGKSRKAVVISEYPTIGQLMKIETLKMELSDGKYFEMAQSNFTTSVFVLDLIDAISTFSTLSRNNFIESYQDFIPKGGSILDIPGSEARLIVEQYRKKFVPWYKEYMIDLYSDLPELKEEGAEDSEYEEKK